MGRTLPFTVLRMAVYFGVAVAYVLITGIGAGIGWGIGGFGDEGFRAGTTFWGGVIGFGAVGAVMYFLREYILYIVKAGHIAVLVELSTASLCRKGARKSPMRRRWSRSASPRPASFSPSIS